MVSSKVDKINEWLKSGEYQSSIDEMRTEIMKESANSKSEANTASIFENELYHLIRTKTGVKIDFSKEQALGNIKHRFGSSRKRTSNKGRLDAVVSNLVIEYKHHKKLQSQQQFLEAVEQVEEYLYALLDNENEKYSAILTDGVRISYFSFSGTSIRHTLLAAITNKDIDVLIKAILANDKKKFVSINILKDFAVNAKNDSISKSIANILFSAITSSATDKTMMLYNEWKTLMHLSVEDNGKSNDIEKRRKDLSLIFEDTINTPEKEYQSLFALQTTYAIIVKLIACKVLEKEDFSGESKSYYDLSNISSTELQRFFEKMEDGYSYKTYNINNFLEGDFFSWYSDKGQWSTEFYRLILTTIRCIDEYTAFNFNIYYEPIDIFKDLYMSIIPKSIRHSMGEYFTPSWLADYVVTESIRQVGNTDNWKAIDPCCGSGIFIITLIKHIVGDKNLHTLSTKEKQDISNDILSRVYGIDINPLSVLSARVGYYLALQPFGQLNNIDIPIYLGDSAITPIKDIVDGVSCYRYSVTNLKAPFEVLLPERFVKLNNFGEIMSEFQACVKTNSAELLFTVIESNLNEIEKNSPKILSSIKELSNILVYLHKNNWDGIWIRITTNFMLIARLSDFDMIVGNPPWVKWEHLPALYAEKIKELCSIKRIFSSDGQFGGTQLNICALISNVTATNWLKATGVLAFLMPDSIMSQNSYEEFRNFYIDYHSGERLYLQKIDKWEAPLRPFRCEEKPITQDFNTYYFSSNITDYKKGVPVKKISRKRNISDQELNKFNDYNDALPYLVINDGLAQQLAENSTAFSYASSKFDFSKIIGDTSYSYRTGVEFTPQELYMLVEHEKSLTPNHFRFKNKKFKLSKYIVDEIPQNGWDLSNDYIYPIVTGPNIKPFKYEYANEYCILPYNPDNIKSPVDSKTLMKEHKNLFKYLVKHKELIDQQSEKSKLMHRGTEFYSLSKLGTYTFAPHIVAARDNSKFCASVIYPTVTAWGELKQTICVKHTIIISQDKSGRNITDDESHFICGILNSSIVIDYMHSSFKSNGYSLNKSNIHIPLFDPNNDLHNQIVKLARNASDEISVCEIQDEITKVYLQICDEKQ